MNLRVGLVGGGFPLRTQLPALRACGGFEVVWLAGRDAARTAERARTHGIPHAGTDLDELLQRAPVDLVCVATPPHRHAADVGVVLAHRTAVLCEKPLARDAAEARRMARAAHEAGVPAYVDHQLRFSPAFRALKAALDAGELGRPLHAEFTLRVGGRVDPERPFDWWSRRDAGGGILGALGSHAVDMLRWLFGPPRSVTADWATCIPDRPTVDGGGMRAVETDDWASFTMRHDAMRTTTVVSAVAHAGGGIRLEVFGTGGSACVDEAGGLRLALRTPGRRGSAPASRLETRVDGATWEPPPAAAGGAGTHFDRAFHPLARALRASLAQGRALADAATLDDGAAVQVVLDALAAAADRRCALDLPLEDRAP